eukprot:6287526-Prymnesium_polylepis.1
MLPTTPRRRRSPRAPRSTPLTPRCLPIRASRERRATWAASTSPKPAIRSPASAGPGGLAFAHRRAARSRSAELWAEVKKE